MCFAVVAPVSHAMALASGCAALAAFSLLFATTLVCAARSFTAGDAILLARGASVVLAKTLLDVLPGSERNASPRGADVLTHGALLLAALAFLGLTARLAHGTDRGGRRSHRTMRTLKSDVPSLRPSGWALLWVQALGWAAAAVWMMHPGITREGAKGALWLLSPANGAVLLGWTALAACSIACLAAFAVHALLPSILIRKLFHLTVLAIVVPGCKHTPDLLRVASAGGLLAVVLCEAWRLQGPGRAPKTLTSFLGLFTDARDSGKLIMSHASLLLGMAAPVWVLPLPDPIPHAGGGRGHGGRALAPAMSGVLALGIGDVASVLGGRMWGTARLCGDTDKTVEGTLAGAVTMCAAGYALDVFMGGGMFGEPLEGSGGGVWGARDAAFCIACVASSLVEGFTHQMDNLYVPLCLLGLTMAALA